MPTFDVSLIRIGEANFATHTNTGRPRMFITRDCHYLCGCCAEHQPPSVVLTKVVYLPHDRTLTSFCEVCTIKANKKPA
jgi:hypothetical protein